VTPQAARPQGGVLDGRQNEKEEGDAPPQIRFLGCVPVLDSPKGASRRAAPPRGCVAPATGPPRRASPLLRPGGSAGSPELRGKPRRTRSSTIHPFPRAIVPPALPPVAATGKPASALGLHPGSAPNRLPSPPTSRSQPSPPSGRPAQPRLDNPAPEGTASPHRNQPGSAWWGTPPRDHRQAGVRPATGHLETTGKPMVAARPGATPASTASRRGWAQRPQSLDRPVPRKRGGGPAPGHRARRPEGPRAVQPARLQDRLLSTGSRSSVSAAARRPRHASPGVGLSFRASAVRYQLGVAFADPPAALARPSKRARWLMASSRSRLDRTPRGTMQASLMDLPSPSETHPTSGRPKPAPLMRFPAPTAHQAREIHLHGIPRPLRSAFAVGPALTVCSPPDPAGLFHPAALMGFSELSASGPAPPRGRRTSLPMALRFLLRTKPRLGASWKGYSVFKRASPSERRLELRDKPAKPGLEPNRSRVEFRSQNGDFGTLFFTVQNEAASHISMRPAIESETR